MWQRKKKYPDFKEKVIIITGSSQGIGRATAIAFCQQGAKVMLNGRDEKKLKQTYEEFVKQGFIVDYYATDVTKYDNCQKLITHTIASFGQIDVLITNASISMNARFDEMLPQYFKDVLDSNLYGTIMPAFASLNALKHSQGSLVFIGSVAGFYGLPHATAYSSGKMALTAFSQSLRAELQHSGIHVGIVYVGFTQNDENKKVFTAAGELVSVAYRPRHLQQSPTQVATSILTCVARRRKQMTLSGIGKTLHAIVRISPYLVSTFINWSQQQMQKMYE